MIVALVGILGAMAIALIALGMRKPSEAVIRERLSNIAPGTAVKKPQVRALEEMELSRPFQDRGVNPLLAAMARVTRRLSPGTTMEKTEQRLAQAGNPRGLNVESFYGLKGMVAIVVVVLMVGVMYLNVMPGTVPYPPEAPASALEWGVGALILGFFFPDLW